MLKVIKQKIQHNWSKTWFDFQLKITKRVLKNNRGEGTIKGALTALTVGIVPIDYIFFKNSEEKYAAQLSMLNTLLHENLLTPKSLKRLKLQKVNYKRIMKTTSSVRTSEAGYSASNRSSKRRKPWKPLTGKSLEP